MTAIRTFYTIHVVMRVEVLKTFCLVGLFFSFYFFLFIWLFFLLTNMCFNQKICSVESEFWEIHFINMKCVYPEHYGRMSRSFSLAAMSNFNNWVRQASYNLNKFDYKSDRLVRSAEM